MGVNESFGAGFVPDVQRLQFYVAWSLATLSCLPLHKSFALNGFSIIPNEKTPFPGPETCAYAQAFVYMARLALFLLILWQTATQ